MKKMSIIFIVFGLSLVGCSQKEQLETSVPVVKSNSETKMEHFDLKETKVAEVPKESTKPVAIVYDKEIGVWLSEMNAMLSAPLDDPRLKEANNDEGFEYYLKSQKGMALYPNRYPLGDSEFGIEFSNLNMLESRISNLQFTRTSHLNSYGQAMEDTSLYDQWKPSDDDMQQAFEYFSQLVNDLDVAFNHGGEGETFGVTHILNGDKVSEMEDFMTGKSSRME